MNYFAETLISDFLIDFLMGVLNGGSTVVFHSRRERGLGAPPRFFAK